MLEWNPDLVFSGPWLSLIGLFVIAFLSNGTIPLPITFYVLWMGQFGMPFTVILVGTAGTVCGWLWMGKRLMALIPESTTGKVKHRIPKKYQEILLRHPRWAVFMVNALPFPWDIIRVLAVLHGITPSKLTFSLTLGRIIRYGMLVYLGAMLDELRWLFLLIMVILIIPVIIRLTRHHHPALPDGITDGMPEESLKT